MQPRVLITNHGTHSAQEWAVFTVDGLVEIDGKSPDAAAGYRMKADMIEVLASAFDAIMVTEKAALAGDATARYAASISPEIDSVDEAVDALIKCADNTPFEGFYREPGKRDSVKAVLDQHFARAIDIERSTHADKNPTAEAALYKEVRQEIGAADAHAFLGELRGEEALPLPGENQAAIEG